MHLVAGSFLSLLDINFRLIKKAPTRIELVIEVLQTFALPLGYGAILYIKRFRANDSDGNRTRVTAVKGRCLNRLTMGPRSFMILSGRQHQIK